MVESNLLEGLCESVFTRHVEVKCDERDRATIGVWVDVAVGIEDYQFALFAVINMSVSTMQKLGLAFR